jgi:hypothetical protein
LSVGISIDIDIGTGGRHGSRRDDRAHHQTGNRSDNERSANIIMAMIIAVVVMTAAVITISSVIPDIHIDVCLPFDVPVGPTIPGASFVATFMDGGSGAIFGFSGISGGGEHDAGSEKK